MFNMKTSDLFKRAKQLADLEGSDFISWNEAINCINESYVGLYEKLINMGDNSFIGSFHMGKGAKVLPPDFWQLKGVYLYNNGNLQTINRRADNEGIHHLGYELRNGQIELYGNPADVLVEYYLKPKKLFFKPNPISVSLPEETTFLDCSGHLFLYADEDISHNPVLSIYDVDEVRSTEGVLTPGTKNYITKDFVIAQTDGDITVYDMATGYSATIGQSIPIVTEKGDLFVLNDNKICRVLIGDNTYTLIEVQPFTNTLEGTYIVCDDKFEDFYYVNDGTLYHNGNELTVQADKIIYADGKCYFLSGSFGFIDIENNVTYIDYSTGRYIGFVGINERTGYGYATKKFNSFYIEPYCEDTELNFPNSFYYQIVSYILAIAFRCKQGADVSLLSSQLAMIEQTFEDTLGSDTFQFPRMGNVYN